MAGPAEEFFISKIEEGLSYSSDSLSEEERRLLRTTVIDLPQTPAFTPEKGQRLNAKCVGALAEAYARDTAGMNRNATLLWRENNEQLYLLLFQFLQPHAAGFLCQLNIDIAKEAPGVALDFFHFILGLAKPSLQRGLSLKPGAEARELAVKLLGMFR